MKRTTRILLLFLTPLFALLLISWGYTGHYRISHDATLSFPPELEEFMHWADILAAHASDADDRKATDPNEGPRHYIDIDNYPGFQASGKIPQSYDSAVALYGLPFVVDQGVLPWATRTAYDSLVACFYRYDFDRAVLFAADLGHYVADGHMPLHITRNYNGQYTNQYGIHSRFESSMINTFISQVSYTGGDISPVADVTDYVFQYLYENYPYVDSILAADTYAQGVSGGNTGSYAYKAALWEKSKGFTTRLFSQASHALAELIHAAWVEAGKPLISAQGINPAIEEFLKAEVFPNPFAEKVTVSLDLQSAREVLVQVINPEGVVIDTLSMGTLAAGRHTFSWAPPHAEPGLYFIVLTSHDGLRTIRKIVKV